MVRGQGGRRARPVRQARIGAARLADGDFDGSRTAYRAAIAADPRLFEAQYGLAVLEADAGRAKESLDAAREAVQVAPHGAGKAAAEQLIEAVGAFAKP